MPDLRGLFLRGKGGESASLGITQLDNAYFSSSSVGKITFKNAYQGAPEAGGHNIVHPAAQDMYNRAYLQHDFYITGFELSSTLGVTETRPKNMAVRYLIRALP